METQLKAELDRLRFVTTQARKADESETKKAAQQIKHLEAELATVRAKAEDARTRRERGQRAPELRAQMAEMREAAAQHARAAAAEAVLRLLPRGHSSADRRHHAVPVAERSEDRAASPKKITRAQQPGLSQLVAAQAAGPVAVENASILEEPEESIAASRNVRRHAKWALPVAACLLLVTNTGTRISTVARLVQTDEKPTASSSNL